MDSISRNIKSSVNNRWKLVRQGFVLQSPISFASWYRLPMPLEIRTTRFGKRPQGHHHKKTKNSRKKFSYIANWHVIVFNHQIVGIFLKVSHQHWPKRFQHRHISVIVSNLPSQPSLGDLLIIDERLELCHHC